MDSSHVPPLRSAPSSCLLELGREFGLGFTSSAPLVLRPSDLDKNYTTCSLDLQLQMKTLGLLSPMITRAKES
jgi:hypothetical protein